MRFAGGTSGPKTTFQTVICLSSLDDARFGPPEARNPIGLPVRAR